MRAFLIDAAVAMLIVCGMVAFGLGVVEVISR